MQKTFRLLLVAAAIILGAIWFSHWSKTRALNSGAVHMGDNAQDAGPNSVASETSLTNPGQASPPQKASPQQETSPASSAAMIPQHPGPITGQPAANALNPHPPSGFVTPATQKFALYRQGDLTYRLNTQSGQACVLFASEDLWRKPLVYQHGCGSR
jgi:hypothetical protein